jgi:glutamate-5-semialdehyde dehydrogenase
MSDPADSNSVQLQHFCQTIARQAKDASRKLAHADSRAKDQWLRACAATFELRIDQILQANQEDYQSAQSAGLSAANLDRLQLNRQRVMGIAGALRAIADLPDPVGEIIEGYRRPSGIEVRKVRVPIGVIFFIYEARPNVTSDAAAICVKSGNAVILRCGKEAIRTSTLMAGLMVEQLEATGLPRHAIQMIETTDRMVIDALLARPQEIDLAIPRGGEGLIRKVCDLAKMPVLKHFDGNCHVYVDASANLKMAVDLIVNSKCQRMGVCNACESLVLHRSIAPDFLPLLSGALEPFAIELRGDEEVCSILPKAIRASEDDWYREYLGPCISIRTVASIEEAIAHINQYGSHHTDAIVTSCLAASRKFAQEVDSAAVMINASTRFNDGGELGLGAEIGISTGKFHARGPCGLKELTTTKFIVTGEGHIRQ